MKKYYEWVQKIPSNYVGEDCIKIMIPLKKEKSISILNSDGMIYHYKPDSELFIDNYVTDIRKEQFPNLEIRAKEKKFEYVNQIFDLNRIYISITNGEIIQYYATKIENEVFIATKYLISLTNHKKGYITREEVENLIKSSNVGIYTSKGDFYKKIGFPSEVDMLNKRLNCSIDDAIFVTALQGEISNIKTAYIIFGAKDRYFIESYDIPITIYNLERFKQLQKRNTSEPKVLVKK